MFLCYDLRFRFVDDFDLTRTKHRSHFVRADFRLLQLIIKHGLLIGLTESFETIKTFMHSFLPWVRGDKMFICLFFNRIYKQIIHPSLSLLLYAFPACSFSSIQVITKHGLSLFSVKAASPCLKFCEIMASKQSIGHVLQ